MLEILRMQLRQMLGGRKKWLVVLFLLLPIGITWINPSLGGLGRLRQQLERGPGEAVEVAPEPPSPNARRIVSTGEPVELFEGRIVVLPGEVLFDGERFGRGMRLSINRGWIVVEDGVVWVDDTKRRQRPGVSIHARRHGGEQMVEALRQVPRPWQMVSAIYLFLLYPQSICLLLALLYGSSVPGAELDGKTLTYLFTRPIARWRIVLGKYLAIVLALLPPTVVSVFASWILLERPGELTLLASMAGGSAGAIACYTALFMLFGFLMPRRAMVAALLYGVVLEFLLSFVPAIVNQFTVTYYLRSWIRNALEIEAPQEIARIVGGATTGTALLTLTLIVVVALALASRLAARREYVIADEA
jgi:ABC-type transport system involved in multi-copper enzyme maturation permease subunit